MLTGHWDAAGILWKDKDEVVHLELFLSIFADSTHGKTETREESTDHRRYHSAAAGALLWAREQWQCTQGCNMSTVLLAKVISCIV